MAIVPGQFSQNMSLTDYVSTFNFFIKYFKVSFSHCFDLIIYRQIVWEMFSEHDMTRQFGSVLIWLMYPQCCI